jgi:diguanylate cyclase (GGDEF)-like protein
MLRTHLWIVLPILLVLVGTVSSLVAALGVSHAAVDQSHRAFAASSAEIASNLKLAIQHEQDLDINAGALCVRDPGTTQAEFLQWTSSVAAFTRYPELQGLSELALVPASQLSAFAAKEQLDPPGPLSSNGTFQVSPPGSRPYYCLETVSQSRNTSLTLPAGIDYCKTSLGSMFLKTAGNGKSMYIPYKTGKTEELGLGTAIYAGGKVPSTVAGRRAALIGWTGIEILPGVVLKTALSDHPNTAVFFHYGAGSSNVTFKAGTAPAHPQTTTIALGNGWTVQTYGRVQAGGLLSNSDALALLIAGIAMSLLLSALVYVLGTGRARARHKLSLRTGELRFQALHDSLTGLPNRALILDRTELMLARSRRNQLPLAAMFLDLDDFKDVNDSLGHSAGDELLVEVASRLSATLREGDTVGRLGGDEFVLLVEGASLSAGADVVADRILDALRAPFQITGSDVPLSVSASIGIATGDRNTPDELLRDADVALYRSKAAGKGCAMEYAPSMQIAAQDHRLLVSDMRSALADNQFFLLYQPTINLETNAFTGVEALLRWQHPTRGIVEPDAFIPEMESSGLIISVGAWVLEEACRQGAAWHAEGHRFTISVNVSAKQLEQERIVEDVQLALAASGLDPAALILELTETTLMNDVEQAVARVRHLKELGIRVAVDDFGTGYSSLAYLRQFPIDILKIDRSFVSGIADSVESAAIVRTLVQLGKVLKLETIAEGIEDDDQRLRLQAENVDTGQGFLFARPLAAVAIDQYLKDHQVEFGGAIPVGSSS